MAKFDSYFDRLMRSAASVPDESTAEIPFGFETRVIANWRANNGHSHDALSVSCLVRRVAITAAALSLVATVGAYQQISERQEMDEPLSNDYAIADSAIQTELSP